MPDKDPPAPEQVPAPPVSVLIEKDNEGKYTVRTSDLAFIASELRGRSRFSVFNSIILPLFVVLCTTLVTTAIGSLFQYVSWRNSTKLQAANDRATRANTAYEKASMAVGKRYYSTFLYLAAVRDLANLKSANTRLYELSIELDRRRFDAYYQQLRDWNETYDQMLTEIDFSMDRPVEIAERVAKAKLAAIDCGQTLVEQLQRHGMNAVSLKVQFAAISHCLTIATADFSAQKDRAVVDPGFVVDERIKNNANDALNAISGMANEFRCHALLRIQYFNQLKDDAIFKPTAWLKAAVVRWQSGEPRPNGFDADGALTRCKV
jgi:hypothetical protein